MDEPSVVGGENRLTFRLDSRSVERHQNVKAYMHDRVWERRVAAAKERAEFSCSTA